MFINCEKKLLNGIMCHQFNPWNAEKGIFTSLLVLQTQKLYRSWNDTQALNVNLKGPKRAMRHDGQMWFEGFLSFNDTMQPLQRIENDVELLGEHLSLGASLHYPPATHPALAPHSTQLHFLSHDPLPQEFFGVVS